MKVKILGRYRLLVFSALVCFLRQAETQCSPVLYSSNQVSAEWNSQLTCDSNPCTPMGCGHQVCFEGATRIMASATEVNLPEAIGPHCPFSSLVVAGRPLCGFQDVANFLVDVDGSDCILVLHASSPSWVAGESSGFRAFFDKVTDCPPDHGCQNGATCVMKATVPVQHCICPHGYTGSLCETAWARECGYMYLTSVSGEVTLPTTCLGNFYCGMLDCTWQLCPGLDYVRVDVTALDLQITCLDVLIIGDTNITCDPDSTSFLLRPDTSQGCVDVRFIAHSDPYIMQTMPATGFTFTFTGIAHESTTCGSNPCLNGGACVPTLEAFNCTCTPAYYGMLCQTAQPTTATTTDPTTMPGSSVVELSRGFFERAEGIAVIVVISLAGTACLVLLGYGVYALSKHHSTIRPEEDPAKVKGEQLDFSDAMASCPPSASSNLGTTLQRPLTTARGRSTMAWH